MFAERVGRMIPNEHTSWEDDAQRAYTVNLGGDAERGYTVNVHVTKVKRIHCKCAKAPDETLQC